jgi:predicted RNA binding protein YcfA (HicA-like mRNA interferase family)
MLRKIRQVIKDLEGAEFVSLGRKGRHRNVLHEKKIALTISGELGDDARPLPEATVGKTFSEKLQLKAGSELHRTLIFRILQAGESLNSGCVNVLCNSVPHSENSSG